MLRVRIAIVNYRGANSAALLDALEALGADATPTLDPAVIRGASHVILPGIGSAADAMRRLTRDQLDRVISSLTQPVLGIGLGMQLLTRWSEEEDTECLGMVPARVEKLHESPRTPVPNSGWCPVFQTEYHSIFDSIAEGSFFHFDHSYAVPVDSYTLATASHADPFTAVLSHENFFACQFYPEQSAEAGSIFLRNFLRVRV